MAGLPLIVQIVLLVLWYTAFPLMPAWLVFLPIILGGIAIVFTLVVMAISAYVIHKVG